MKRTTAINVRKRRGRGGERKLLVVDNIQQYDNTLDVYRCVQKLFSMVANQYPPSSRIQITLSLCCHDCLATRLPFRHEVSLQDILITIHTM